MLDLVHSKGEQLLNENPYHEYQVAAEQALKSGLIRKKTQEEIDEELKGKPWLQVNKIIRKNEARNDMATNSNPDSD